MKTRTVACLIAFLFAATSFAADAEPAKQLNPLFASSPRVLTQSQLNQLELPIRFLDEHVVRWKKLRQQVAADETNEALQKQLASELAYRKRASQSPIGLFLAKTAFRLDEPATAYFVVKNATRGDLGLDLRLDLHFGEQCINSCGLYLECVKAAEGFESERVVQKKIWHCGGPSLLTLPEGGYYCTSGDLRTMGATVPGEYKMHWVGVGCRSQDVAFTMLPAKNQEARFQPITAARIFKLGEDHDGEEAVDEARKIKDPPAPPLLDPAHLIWSRFEPFAASLATGADERFYPDIMNLPARDKFINVTARFEKPTTGSIPTELVLMLNPRQRQKGLVIRDTSHVYLITSIRDERLREQRDFRPRDREAMERMKAMEIGHSLADPTKPLSIRFRLHDGWHNQLKLAGNVEVRVMICSEEIEPQSRWPKLKALKRELDVIRETTEWKGLLCTPPISIRLSDMGQSED